MGGLNLFAYCENNPVNYIDAQGTVAASALIVGCAASALTSLVLVAAIVVSIIVISAVVYKVANYVHRTQSRIVWESSHSTEKSVSKAVQLKSVASSAASPQPPDDDQWNNKSKKSNNQGKGSFKTISEYQLKRYGLDAHKIKYDILGKRARISRYNMYYNTKTGQIFIAENGSSHFIPTELYIP